ncbi:hypothetical protein BFP72_06850 [Reichenbachiella sp. 5M10]|uniref:FIST signal transduction protein n=1 Tax=Reichenbachiella sp. 5M10 TaxID=1889772 RepID=UPI000C144B0A|nr:FIST N-terminal domain-containing protein [Reichenbachiella sp. 5M10]PIB35133.1 hypothetical protein BFP72_06850 [Reichenbachiella sp. 5M10]
MQAEQLTWSSQHKWQAISNHNLGQTANLVFAFGTPELIQVPERYHELREKYPNADIITASTAEEIINGQVLQNHIVVSALYFEKTTIESIRVDIANVQDSFDAGTHLSADLNKDFISNLLLFADGKTINGDDLITGIHINLSESIPILGGMTGTNSLDTLSLVGLNEPPKEGQVVGVGFSGEHLKIGYGLDTSWSSFGAEKTVTRAYNTRLYEIDGKSPLHFYKQYLEGLVDDVTTECSTYPLGIKRNNGTGKRVIRTVVTVHDDESISFAGNFSKGDLIRMMKSNPHTMIESAQQTTSQTLASFGIPKPDFVLLINCVGRRKVLKDWSSHEVEYVNSEFEEGTPVMGFYSYGEIVPNAPRSKSELHNKSIVITAFRED